MGFSRYFAQLFAVAKIARNGLVWSVVGATTRSSPRASTAPVESSKWPNVRLPCSLVSPVIEALALRQIQEDQLLEDQSKALAMRSLRALLLLELSKVAMPDFILCSRVIPVPHSST